ncbi:hypothetical protein KVV02_004352 [Mortierella alpina]|uniref:Uncharacterized protein n=1 Tax=Mortierella alpina TaxID=64518 RepID=A0A9P8D1J1_MORAP|nr:hypothetical protein KVV02_004352 [Mortierella alpina]
MVEYSPSQTQLLCEWQRSTYNCRDSEYVKHTLLAGAVLYTLVGFFGLWVLRYRHGGFKRAIVTDLCSMEGSGIRPKAIDCFTLFGTAACFLKPLSHILLVFGSKDIPKWIRIAVEQSSWGVGYILIAVLYLVGSSYFIPVTEFEGKFAVYRTSTAHGHLQSEIRVFYPTPHQKNVFLVSGALFPVFFCAPLGIAAGTLTDQGHYNASDILTVIQNINWALILWFLGFIIIYYGVKFTLILRAHIITTEARRELPLAAFGPSNFKSRSPARYLFIMLQVTAFASSQIFFLSGLLNGIQTWNRRSLLESQDLRWYRFLVFMWSCPAALAYFVKLSLIAIHTHRNTVQVPANAPMAASIAAKDDMQSLELLTLHLHPNFSSFSEATQALERALFELAMIHPSGNGPQEDPKHAEDLECEDDGTKVWSTVPALELSSVTGLPFFPSAYLYTTEQDLSLSALEKDESRSQFSPLFNSTSPVMGSEPSRQTQELQRLHLQYESAIERIQRLQTHQQKQQWLPEKTQQLQALEQQGQEVDKMLMRLEIAMEQLQESKAGHLPDHHYCNSTLSPSAVHHRSELRTLQNQVKTSLKQLSRRIDLYQ